MLDVESGTERQTGFRYNARFSLRAFFVIIPAPWTLLDL
jgi:hypothetical protein